MKKIVLAHISRTTRNANMTPPISCYFFYYTCAVNFAEKQGPLLVQWIVRDRELRNKVTSLKKDAAILFKTRFYTKAHELFLFYQEIKAVFQFLLLSHNFFNTIFYTHIWMSLEVFTLRFEVGRGVDANSGDKTKLTYHTKLSIIINIPYRRSIAVSLKTCPFHLPTIAKIA